jgi:epoxyqueuosine reductase
MARKAKVWQAPESALAPMNGLFGNKINGLGEEEYRPAKPFFWHEPQYHEFGDMQGYTLGIMYGLPDAQEINEAFCINPEFQPGPQDKNAQEQFIHRGPDPIEVVGEKIENTPAEWSKLVKDFALSHAADVVGIAEMRPEWVIEGFEVTEKYVIVVGVAHDYEEMSQAPSLPENNNRCIVEVGKQYTRAAAAAAEVSNFIRQQGHDTTCHPGPTAKALLMIPAAIEAGLGELGKHHSVINRELGSSFRLSAVTTNMPLEVDAPDVFGADDFCVKCQVCREACPPDAIYDEKKWVRGTKKWHIDFDKCIPYFAESRGCGICIVVCPWSRPGVADKTKRKAGTSALSTLTCKMELIIKSPSSSNCG